MAPLQILQVYETVCVQHVYVCGGDGTLYKYDVILIVFLFIIIATFSALLIVIVLEDPVP